MNRIENFNIVAIGGSAPAGKASTLLKEGLELTGREGKPNILLIPTPKPTQEAHDIGVAGASKLFVDALGLPTDILHDFDTMPSDAIINEKLEWADLVYISGGDPQRMMEIWQRYSIDTKLQMRAMGGLVLTGISAGAIAPFSWGHSDREHYYVGEGEDWDYVPVDTLGFINAAVTPHNNTEKDGKKREDAFIEMFAKEATPRGTKIGFGIDNVSGLKIHDGQLELRVAELGSGATLLDSRTGKPISSRLDANQPIPLVQLGL